ncbi:hypothetical protein AB6Q56_03420 [Dechloromonas sp. ARDL1]|uniref:hypothetical protein n=1 Tax=Dechloromonas sp. ARDL1 TaxID=3322121 RepID=UPI003DA75D72
MKKTVTLCLAATLAMTINTSALADWGHHRGDFRPPMHGHHHHRGGGWVGPAAVLAIAGMAIGAAAYNNAYAAPAPVYAAPVYTPPAPVYIAPPARSGAWYYCISSGQYYPYTNACPEGWQAVPAR